MNRRELKEKRERHAAPHARQRSGKRRVDHPSSIWSGLSRKWFPKAES
jgi:hypothetical protein